MSCDCELLRATKNKILKVEVALIFISEKSRNFMEKIAILVCKHANTRFRGCVHNRGGVSYSCGRLRVCSAGSSIGHHCPAILMTSLRYSVIFFSRRNILIYQVVVVVVDANAESIVVDVFIRVTQKITVSRRQHP